MMRKPLDSLLEDFISYLKTDRFLSQNSIDTWRPALRGFLRWVASHTGAPADLCHFSPPTLNAYRDYLIQRQRRPRTIRSYFCALRAFGGWLVDTGDLVENPVVAIVLPKLDKPRQHHLSNTEIAALQEAAQRLAHPRQRAFARAVLAVLVYGALRRQEIYDLKIGDVDFGDGSLTVAHGKGDKHRTIYPAPECFAEIKAWMGLRPAARHDYLFAVNVRQRIHEKTLYSLLDSLAAIARVDALVRPHAFRHNTAFYLLEHGYSISDVAAFLGHSSLRTTEIYLNTSGARMKSLARLGSRNGVAGSVPVVTASPSSASPSLESPVRRNAAWRSRRFHRGENEGNETDRSDTTH